MKGRLTAARADEFVLEKSRLDARCGRMRRPCSSNRCLDDRHYRVAAAGKATIGGRTSDELAKGAIRPPLDRSSVSRPVSLSTAAVGSAPFGST